tara:strand:+ start:1784 stop:2011 length:228 start_codon:yes stop_codon:yes gene_type:complete
MRSRKANDLINEYSDLKDQLLDYTSEWHDAMLWDIDGYRYEFDNLTDKDIETLENQVQCFRSILQSIKKLEFVYS